MAYKFVLIALLALPDLSWSLEMDEVPIVPLGGERHRRRAPEIPEEERRGPREDEMKSEVFQQSSSSSSSFVSNKMGNGKQEAHSESESMSKSQECHTIAEDEKCECRQDPKRKESDSCKCVARKLKCSDGKCLCCLRSGCRAHRERDGPGAMADDIPMPPPLRMGPPPSMLRAMMQPPPEMMRPPQFMDDILHAFEGGRREAVPPPSPEKVRRKMEAEWENFFGEFERGKENTRMIRKKRK